MHHLSDKRTKQAADSKLKTAYNQYYSSIYKFCLSRLKDDLPSVEDCVQEAFIVLYNKYLKGEEVEFVQPFLLKTASNLVKKRYAELKRELLNVDIEDVKEIITHSTDIDDRLSFEEYSKMISDALNDTDSEIFRLRYIQELKINEIAEILGMSVTNVSVRISRMKEKIRKLME
ncbi:MAG: RNA polymerase sigma factor [Ruminococcaceae bacterium]|nr:RNA polymerase sigma factor [Oscillospiraceae bacterium]